MYAYLVRHGRLALVMFLLASGTAAAQTITGVVTDSSGAVLPGVTVEARNSANQQPRTVTTDGAGRYVIVNLEPGGYSMTYTLDGFSPTTRPGIVLTSGFTATVDIQLTVGAQTETVTVTAESPLVDVESSAAPQTMNREVLDSLPSGRSPEAFGVLIPGATLRAAGSGSISRDVGGSTMMNQSPLQFRGTNDTVQVLNGMRRVYLRPGPEFVGVYVNDGAVQELTFSQGAEAMDMGQSGMRINIVPKSGGNVFHGTVFGGPLSRDRLWFSLAYRSWGVTNTVAIDLEAHTARRGPASLHLTHREFEILRYLAERRDRVVHRNELLREVWGIVDGSTTRSVDFAVARLRRKIESNPEPRYLRTVHGDGYSLTVDRDG